MTKNKQNYSKIIYNILYNHFKSEFEENKNDLTDKELEKYNFEDYSNKEQRLNYIRTELVVNPNFADELTVVNEKGGEQDEQIGMIEFINQFSNINLKKNDFKIERKEDRLSIKIDYIWKIIFIYKKHKYEYLGDFFTDFVYWEYKKIYYKIIK